MDPDPDNPLARVERTLVSVWRSNYCYPCILNRSYIWPGSVFSCGTLLEGDIVQAAATNNLMLTFYRWSTWPCLSVFNPRHSYWLSFYCD
ncbi:hypothetical protein ILYODFUR_020906 [Ilyodon furcidens]|uniref:Uncharacterized protein n=1 Tax=Ilyodon furcidens TaxID=33524 RepID=A0ABV0SRE9_9TELE